MIVPAMTLAAQTPNGAGDEPRKVIIILLPSFYRYPNRHDKGKHRNQHFAARAKGSTQGAYSRSNSTGSSSH